MKHKAEERWRNVTVRKATRLDGTNMGVLCVTGGLRRSREGAAGFVLDCEERDLHWLGGAPASLRAHREAPPMGAQGGRWSQRREGRLQGFDHIKAIGREASRRRRRQRGWTCDSCERRLRSSGGVGRSFRGSGRRNSGSHGGSPRSRQGRIEFQHDAGALRPGENPGEPKNICSRHLRQSNRANVSQA